MGLQDTFFKAKARQNFEYLQTGRYDKLILVNFKHVNGQNGERFVFEFVPKIAGIKDKPPEGRREVEPSPVDRKASVMFTGLYDEKQMVSLFQALAKRSDNLSGEERLKMLDKLGMPLDEMAKIYTSQGKTEEAAEVYKQLADPNRPARVCHLRGCAVWAKTWWKYNEKKQQHFANWDFGIVPQESAQIVEEREYLKKLGY